MEIESDEEVVRMGKPSLLVDDLFCDLRLSL